MTGNGYSAELSSTDVRIFHGMYLRILFWYQGPCVDHESACLIGRAWRGKEGREAPSSELSYTWEARQSSPAWNHCAASPVDTYKVWFVCLTSCFRSAWVVQDLMNFNPNIALLIFLVTWLTWGPHDNVLSRKTPRLIDKLHLLTHSINRYARDIYAIE